MRTKTINIYTINDHPNPADCFEWIRNNWHDLGQHCVDDMAQSLKALQEKIGGNLDYALSISPDRGEFVRFAGYNKNILAELLADKDNCPLTGMCYDIDVIEGLALGNLESVVLDTLHKEGGYIYGDEGLRDLCEANEYEFLENGAIA